MTTYITSSTFRLNKVKPKKFILRTEASKQRAWDFQVREPELRSYSERTTNLSGVYLLVIIPTYYMYLLGTYPPASKMDFSARGGKPF